MDSLDASAILFALAFVLIVVSADAIERYFFNKNPHDRFKD